MNARAEAFERLGGRYEVRVLEPSPPAIGEGPWFADDPCARGEVPPGRQLVSPVSSGDITWGELTARDEELAAWCAERWLAAWRKLEPAPLTLVETRVALHRLTALVLSPAREKVNGKIALRYTRGGFGTPFYGDDVQLRVEGDEVVIQEGASEHSFPITTLAEAAAGVDVELDMGKEEAEGTDPAAKLVVDPAASRFLGNWYGFVASVLEQLRAEARPDDDVSRVQLWPEHFDLATEMGDERSGKRAGYGGSPGDGDHPEPYLYVVPWGEVPPGPLWQAQHFNGAELSYSELLASDGQRATALEFFRTGRAALLGDTQ